MMRAAARGGKIADAEAALWQRGLSAEDVPTRLLARRLNRLESTLDSLLDSVTAAGAGKPPSPVQRQSLRSRPSLGAAIAEVARRQKDLDDGQDAIRAAPIGELQQKIAELSTKLEEMRHEQGSRYTEPAPAWRVDKLHTDISTMSEALEGLASRGSVAALEQAVRALSQRIEVSRDENIREAVVRPLEQLVDELRHSLAEADPRATIAGIESELRRLGNKLDDVSDLDPAVFRNIQQQSREICDLLTAVVTRPLPIERIERQIEQLAHSIESQRGGEMAYANGRAESGIGARLDAISARIEEALAERDDTRYEALARRIEKVHHELTTLIGNAHPAADTRMLEELVCGLAEKFEQTRLQPDLQGLASLERQITELGQRLEVSNKSVSSLASLEETLNARIADLADAHRAASEAAESVRTRSVEPMNVGSELQRMSALQEESDRRIASTLEAVHETLERVVDRLSGLGSDAPPRPDESLASGPAPVFTPAPRRNPAQGDGADLKDLQIGPQDRAAKRNEPKKETPPPPTLEDLLIEPGSGFPGRREEASESLSVRQTRAPEAEGPATRADFIAAARRAAQAAQIESSAGQQTQTRTALAPKDRAGLFSKARDAVVQHKRPVFLSLAALFVALGAYAVIKTMVHAGPSGLSSIANAPSLAMAVPQKTAKPDATPAPSAALPQMAARTPTPAASGAQSIAPGIDTMPTGSIPAPKAANSDALQNAAEAAAEAGDARAQYLLATDYAEGRHVPRNFAAAATWYAKAAAQGLAPAQYRLGNFYEKGLGVIRDLDQARNWYQKAAEAGNVRAMHNLAVLAADGGEDGKPDYATAAHWFKKAAEYGVRDSQYNLAVLLARGLGVQQDFAAAYTWFSIVAAQGDDDAARKRDDVGARLDADQLAAAKSTADAFRAKMPDPAANDVRTQSGNWSSSSLAPAAPGKPRRAKVTMM